MANEWDRVSRRNALSYSGAHLFATGHDLRHVEGIKVGIRDLLRAWEVIHQNLQGGKLVEVESAVVAVSKEEKRERNEQDEMIMRKRAYLVESRSSMAISAVSSQVIYSCVQAIIWLSRSVVQSVLLPLRNTRIPVVTFAIALRSLIRSVSHRRILQGQKYQQDASVAAHLTVRTTLHLAVNQVGRHPCGFVEEPRADESD